MSLKGKIPPELKIQAVEDYQAIRKGSSEIIKELGIAEAPFNPGCGNIRWGAAAGCIRKSMLQVIHPH